VSEVLVQARDKIILVVDFVCAGRGENSEFRIVNSERGELVASPDASPTGRDRRDFAGGSMSG
jgi:hypothetical protein